MYLLCYSLNERLDDNELYNTITNMLLNLDYIMNTTVIMPHYSIILTIKCNNQAFEYTYAINIECKYVYVCLQSFGQRATTQCETSLTQFP